MVHQADLITIRLSLIVSLSTPGQPVIAVLDTFRAVENRRKPASLTKKPRDFKCLPPKLLKVNDSIESWGCGS